MPESSPSTPLPNDPAARTPDGTLKDAGLTTQALTTPPTTETKPDDAPPTTAAAGGSEQKPATPSGPPAEYKFTPPDGQTYDKATLDAATPVFKELGLTQAQADRLVTFWNERAASQADIGRKAIEAQGEKWMTETKADPVIGSRLETIKVNIGQAFDKLVADGKLTRSDVDQWKFAMDLSMVGNQRAFIKVSDAMALAVIEGKVVTGTGPSPNGQHPSGTTPKPTAAQAMYPHLPSSNR
jgi:hypothetical protein